MRLKPKAFLLSLFALVVLSHAQPEVSFSGFLDADVWADFNGNYFVNQELDIGMTAQFTEDVSANVYATTTLGSIPAGDEGTDRWTPFLFDGFDITFASPVGTFSVGDLVYQYGGFNYYFYKRLSMITPETFIRGVKYSIELGSLNQDVMVGVQDENLNATDANGVTSISLGEGISASAYYGVRTDWLLSLKTGTDIFAGVGFDGTFGEMLSAKLNVGYFNIAGEERAHKISVLAEPSVSMGDFSVATAVFVSIDDDTLSMFSDKEFGVADEFFAYVEPGYSFNDYFAAGLPLEYHAKSLHEQKEEDESFWIVPTFYIYPAENVEWWLWQQTVIPTDKDADLGFAVGSEIIVTF